MIKYFQVFDFLIEQGNDPSPPALTTNGGGQASNLWLKAVEDTS